jgi:murein DD-endopeptidase MepM/ murein hydrolase activator NlpD
MTQVLRKNRIVCSVGRLTKAVLQSSGVVVLLPLAVVALLLSIGLPSKELIRINTSAFVYPLMGTRVSSDYGTRVHPVKRVKRHHHGMDLAAPHGAAVRSIAEGIVIFADPYGGYGKLIVIQHRDGLTSHYGHLQEIKALPGQKVTAGQLIATVGSTGISTGPHLHFEIRVNGEPRDPEKFIPGLALPGEG